MIPLLYFIYNKYAINKKGPIINGPIIYELSYFYRLMFNVLEGEYE